ncbi:hypothetical protein [Neoroseomonas rubea]|uniref:hypothetical protein n=1 Tax=Neoroseomonas rubea TaxID=2748666 RepID=UPI0018DF09DA|nr:hypothetical protein [Roseomonas rubea]
MLRAMVLLACVALFPACSTLSTGTSQAILVATDPPGARCEVRRRGVVIGVVEQTPGTVAVGKSSVDLAVDCARPGFYPGAAAIERRFNQMTYANWYIGGAIGLLVDASTGAWNDYPRSVRIRMQPRETGGSASIAGPQHYAQRAATINLRAQSRIEAERRRCLRRDSAPCIARIEAIEQDRNVALEALHTEQRLREPPQAPPV